MKLYDLLREYKIMHPDMVMPDGVCKLCGGRVEEDWYYDDEVNDEVYYAWCDDCGKRDIINFILENDEEVDAYLNRKLWKME